MTISLLLLLSKRKWMVAWAQQRKKWDVYIGFFLFQFGWGTKTSHKYSEWTGSGNMTHEKPPPPGEDTQIEAVRQAEDCWARFLWRDLLASINVLPLHVAGFWVSLPHFQPNENQCRWTIQKVKLEVTMAKCLMPAQDIEKTWDSPASGFGGRQRRAVAKFTDPIWAMCMQEAFLQHLMWATRTHRGPKRIVSPMETVCMKWARVWWRVPGRAQGITRVDAAERASAVDRS